LVILLIKPGKNIPSGNGWHSYWKWLFIVDLPSYKMVIFHSFLYVYQRVFVPWSECGLNDQAISEWWNYESMLIDETEGNHGANYSQL
jgi:hypothetical protein